MALKNRFKMDYAGW